MPLGLLARDSIANLADFGRDNDAPNSPTVSIPQQFGKDTSGSTVVPYPSAPDDNANYRNLNGNGEQASPSADSNTRAVTDRRQFQTEANPQQPPSFHYAGYTDDYYHDDYDAYTDHDPYSPSNLLLPKTSELGGIWCCLFPWLEKTPQIRATTERESVAHSRDASSHGPSTHNGPSTSATTDEDASREGESTNSHILGERLSDRERQAVLARLRLAQPESIMLHTSNTNGVGNETYVEEESRKLNDLEKNVRPTKGLLNGIPVHDKSPLEKIDLNNPTKLKGILKTRSAHKLEESEVGDTQSAGTASNDSTSLANARKLRRSLFPSYEDRKPRRATQNVSFAPMARVVTVKSKGDMTDTEKGDIWWQRSDYEDFRKAGRIITRAMLEGGSEIWLASNESAQRKNVTLSITGDTIKATGDKWWHKFGHSRRGLEHVVSVDEGRQRQVNVKNAIRAVVEEQSRQKMCKREDPEKVRTVALQHTSWARDLALASAASDAHAVECSFSEGRHSREFYLLKMSHNKPGGAINTSVLVPQFMKPSPESNATKSPIVQQRLDAFTASQIQFRRRKVGSQPQLQLPADADMESMEQVHDTQSEKGKERLAHQAAGFSADGQKVNMAAVLSGMGAVRVPAEETRTVVRAAS